ncbi:MAG: FprA family A-type flavoprotein [Clostridia bacterium]|nr:FprA family A-type flavoprotein [Clostridia bacterium]
MKISNDVKYVGVNDKNIDLFESQYRVPNGISYNSYVIIDERIAVLDTTDAAFATPWLENIKNTLDNRSPDYLIVQHMEPDHSANIKIFLDTYPKAVVVASAKAFSMMKGFFGTDYPDRRIVVSDGSSLSLGKHTLSFITAPMVHWPEVIVTYDKQSGILFSADAFGKFGALDVDEEWADEARRYYIGIVGKYGAQVTALLKNLGGYDIKAIAPLHGPVLSEDLDRYIGLYSTWASYEAEEDGVVIAYTSVYGNTKKAAELLEKSLRDKGVHVSAFDLSRCDMSEATASAFRYSKLVLATTTYNADIFPHMREFINHLTERNYQKRTVGMIENGTWAPMAARVMRGMLEGSRDIALTNTTVRILSSLSDENEMQIASLASELCP